MLQIMNNTFIVSCSFSFSYLVIVKCHFYPLQVMAYPVVVAIDFGTACSGYAYGKRTDSNTEPVYMNKPWHSREHRLESLKTPTCILLDRKGKFHSFGYDAENKYADLASEGKHKEWYYFENIKMILYKSKVM